MKEALVKNLEGRLGFRLPEDYREFLVAHGTPLLENPLVFEEPVSGIVDELLTVEQILQNDDKQIIGIPERSLLHIGGNLSGGYLYLKVSKEGFGEIHYMENYTFRGRFPSLGDLLRETERKAEHRRGA